jgi:signal transduction histidine kinase
MRIQTRLFLGTAVLVLALTAAQWWLHQRQLRAMESELAAVATSVGRDLLKVGPDLLVRPLGHDVEPMLWVDGESAVQPKPIEDARRDVHVMVIPEDADGEVQHKITRKVLRTSAAPGSEIDGDELETVVETEVVADRLELRTGESVEAYAIATRGEPLRFALKVEAGEQGVNRFLVVTSDDGEPKKIPIPVEPAVRSYRSTMHRGAVVSGVLLVVGLVGAAVVSNRVSRPLRELAEGSEAVGRGEFGVQVPVTGVGEVAELQGAFNSMSARLAELEQERNLWQEREHLAQLGDLSRGLAHTVRNPLNTLGLAVEELATVEGGRPDLVGTARAQIRRIDQWLRSFLALGAADAAEPSPEDLGDLARAVVFEAVQQGASVHLAGSADEVPVVVVVTAVRAALANLVENAAEVTPPGEPVEVGVRREGDVGVVEVRDRGPGLSEEVRLRLFQPHITTKVGGSGMGLFLARQIIVGMHGGELVVDDHPEGGTIAVMKLPLTKARTDDGQ